MNKKEFLNLPTNKKTIELLYNESIKRFNDSTLVESNWFFNEVATALRNYVYLPKSVKSIVDIPTTESLYNDYLRIKELGYRSELKMPF